MSNCITTRRNLLSIRTALRCCAIIMLPISLSRSRSVDDHANIICSSSMNIGWIIVIMVSSGVWSTIYSSNIISTRRNLRSTQITLWSCAMVMLPISLNRSRSVDDHTCILCCSSMNIDWITAIMVSSGVLKYNMFE